MQSISMEENENIYILKRSIKISVHLIFPQIFPLQALEWG